MLITSKVELTQVEADMIKNICFNYNMIYNKYRDRIIESWHHKHITAEYILNEERLDIDIKIIEACLEQIIEYKDRGDLSHLSLYQLIPTFRSKNVKIHNDILKINDILFHFPQLSSLETGRSIDYSKQVCYARLVKLKLIKNELIATIDASRCRINKKGAH